MESHSQTEPLSPESQIQFLQNELAKKNRILELITKIDQIRDQMKDPLSMLSSIVELVAQNFRTDLCLLALIDEESEQLELRVVHRKNRNYPAELEQLIDRNLMEQVMDYPTVTRIRGSDLVTMPDPAQVPEIVVMPIAINHQSPLGVMLLICSYERFSDDDIECLTVLEDHIDSAVIQGNNYYELEHRHKQLRLIYKVDQIRDQHLPLEKMLNQVLREVVQAIPSEMGFVMIYSQSEKTLSMRATAGEDLFSIQNVVNVVDEQVERALQVGQLVYQNGFDHPSLRSSMCVPLILKERVIGVIGVLNRFSTNGFVIKDRQALKAIGSQIDTAIYETMEKRHLRNVLGRAVGPRIMDQILNSDEDVLKSEKMVLSVLYADIRGSTALTEEVEPEVMVEIINDYLHHMNDVVLSFDGTLDKFVGDEVMALFGAPVSLPDHAMRAVKVGLEMQRVHTGIMRKWQARGIRARPIGVGIATGELIVGEMGSHTRTDYTVMGRAANLGARICAVAKGGQVLICPETHRLIRDEVLATPMEPVKFKGIPTMTTVYSIQELKSSGS